MTTILQDDDWEWSQWIPHSNGSEQARKEERA